MLSSFQMAAQTNGVSTVKIITQGRNVSVTPAIREYAETKVSRAVHKFEATVKEVDVRLSVSGGDAGKGPRAQKTEITIYTLRNGVVRAEDQEESLYASIDLVCDKVQRKLRKLKERAIMKGKWPGHGGPKGATPISQELPTDDEELEEGQALPAFAEEPTPGGEDAKEAEVLRTKTFYLEPMTQDEALEQVEQVGHNFFIFRDLESSQVKVLYKRKTRGYGVIVPTLD